MLWQVTEGRRVEFIEPPFFELSDLCDIFEEWSAYGIGVPLRLQSGSEAMQYYVPYISGFQLFSRSDSWLARYATFCLTVSLHDFCIVSAMVV